MAANLPSPVFCEKQEIRTIDSVEALFFKFVWGCVHAVAFDRALFVSGRCQFMSAHHLGTGERAQSVFDLSHPSLLFCLCGRPVWLADKAPACKGNRQGVGK